MWDLFDVQREVRARHQAEQRETDARAATGIQGMEATPGWHLRAV
jgi:hypothetical protein